MQCDSEGTGKALMCGTAMYDKQYLRRIAIHLSSQKYRVPPPFTIHWGFLLTTLRIKKFWRHFHQTCLALWEIRCHYVKYRKCTSTRSTTPYVTWTTFRNRKRLVQGCLDADNDHFHYVSRDIFTFPVEQGKVRSKKLHCFTINPVRQPVFSSEKVDCDLDIFMQ